MQNVSAEVIGNKLRFTLLPGVEIDEDEDFLEVIEHQLCNGWDVIAPEMIGALTDAPIVSDQAEFDENDAGKLAEIGRVFWYPEYQIRNPTAELIEKGFVEFSLAD